MSENDGSGLSHLEGSFAAKVANLAQRLRKLADEVEREGVATPDWTRRGDEGPSYFRAAERVVHRVAWGAANLNLEELISAAAEIQYERERVAAEAAARTEQPA